MLQCGKVEHEVIGRGLGKKALHQGPAEIKRQAPEIPDPQSFGPGMQVANELSQCAFVDVHDVQGGRLEGERAGYGRCADAPRAADDKDARTSDPLPQRLSVKL